MKFLKKSCYRELHNKYNNIFINYSMLQYSGQNSHFIFILTTNLSPEYGQPDRDFM